MFDAIANHHVCYLPSNCGPLPLSTKLSIPLQTLSENFVGSFQPAWIHLVAPYRKRCTASRVARAKPFSSVLCQVTLLLCLKKWVMARLLMQFRDEDGIPIAIGQKTNVTSRLHLYIIPHK